MTPARITRKRQLERSGFRHVAGWLTEAQADIVEAMIAADSDKVDAAATSNGKRVTMVSK